LFLGVSRLFYLGRSQVACGATLTHAIFRKHEASAKEQSRQRAHAGTVVSPFQTNRQNVMRRNARGVI